jgi:hypothetical protein
VIGLAAISAQAALVTSLPGGTAIPMPAIEYFGPGPQNFGPGITWSSTNSSNQGGSVFGYTGSYGFLGNGSWTGSLGPMAGLNDSKDFYGVTDTMTFEFSTPIAGVGGFINYVPGSNNPTVISVYDSSNTLIETSMLTFSTSGGDNTGLFYGFLEDSPNISYFTLTDNYIGITDLTTSGPSAVPEPATMLLLGSGLLGMGVYARRRFSKK